MYSSLALWPRSLFASWEQSSWFSLSMASFASWEYIYMASSSLLMATTKPTIGFISPLRGSEGSASTALSAFRQLRFLMILEKK